MLGEGVRAMRSIPGYEGRYSAEEDGRIFSHLAGRYLRPGWTGENGAYRHVSLGRGHTRNVHDLILRTFRGAPPEGMEGRHLDGIGSNNALTNLVWSTHSVNLLDKNAHGTMPKGERHHACAISDADVVRLLAKRATGLSYPKLGKLFGISTSQAHRIVTGQNRKET
jgi:hypothetical protein